jgi:hypothetical protein
MRNKCENRRKNKAKEEIMKKEEGAVRNKQHSIDSERSNKYFFHF